MVMSVSFSTPMTTLPPIQPPTIALELPSIERNIADTTQTTSPAIYPQNKVDLYKCSCVEGLRYFGVDLPPRPFDAKNFIGTDPPSVGGVVIFYYAGNDTWHVALIVELHADYMLVREWNFEPCAETWRRVAYDDKAIYGFSSF